MKTLKSVIESFFRFFGYRITLEKTNKIKVFENSGLNLNIGAGDYHITNFVSLDFKTGQIKKTIYLPFMISEKIISPTMMIQ